MGYIKGQFTSMAGHTYSVYVYSPNQTTNHNVELTADPVHISYDRGETKYQPFKSMMCTIKIVDESDFTHLYSDTPFDAEVEVIDETAHKTMFKGYLIPSMWTTEARLGLKHTTLNAVDALGMLKYVDTGNRWRVISSPRSIFETMMTEMNFDEEEIINTYDGDSKVSVDALLPDDHTASLITENWPTYEDLLNAINRYTHTTTMIWEGAPINANIDTYLSTYWRSSATADANNDVVDDNLSVEIEPAYSRVEYTPDGDEKVFINDIIGGIDTEHIQKVQSQSIYWEENKTTYLYCWASMSEQSRVRDISLEAVGSSYGNRANVMFYSTYGEGEEPSTDWKPLLFNKCNLLADAKHTVFAGQNLFITANIFIEQALAITPRLWQASTPEDKTQSYDDDGNAACMGAHLALRVGNRLIYPSYVENKMYNPDVPGFYQVVYHFFNLPQGLVEPTIINTDSGSIFIQSLEVTGSQQSNSIYNGSYSVFDVLQPSFRRPLNIHMPFMGDGGVSIDFKAHTEGDDKTTLMSEMRRQFRQQYQHSRKIFTCALPLAGFHPFKKVRWDSLKCTIDAADIDLRKDKVTVQLLESY